MIDKKFDLDDIVIIPSEMSYVNSRSECDCTVNDFITPTLPLIAAPMDTVVSKDNYKKFIENGIIPCISRGVEIENGIDSEYYFKSYGLSEIEDALKYYKNKVLRNVHFYDEDNNIDKFYFYKYPNILIDIANGHMAKLMDIIREIKSYFPKIKLMVGNISNPETFINLGLVGADYVRCSIGTGCFVPGQLVITKDGQKFIENINIGDEVLTHQNEYKQVINKYQYYINDEIYQINDIKCTQNHEFFVIDKNDKRDVDKENISKYAKWISAKDLCINKHCIITLTPFNILNIDSIQKYLYEGTVYDLEIHDDHSYNINGVIVHNSACTTAANVSINYPIGSLITECYKLRSQYDIKTKIVADGGMRNYSDIIKSLALGCFLPPSLVYTKKGFKQIKDIKLGDEVFTHTGTFKKVIKKFTYRNKKDIISINGVYSTDDHHYYVVKKIHKYVITKKNIHAYAEWVRAKDLTTDYLLIKKDMNIFQQIELFFKNIITKTKIKNLKLKKNENKKQS